nr:MAG TPA: Minor structural protein [Caudoviricetes sp.]
MYQTSEEFGNLIQQDSRTFYALLYFDGNTITDGISEITIEGGSNSEDDFSIGSAVSRYAKIKMTNPAKRIEGKEITINIGMMVGESIEYVPMGYYTAEKPKTDESQITVTAYDRMMKTERAFSADGIAETTDTVTVLNAISRITGVTVVTDGLTAISMQRPDSYTCREILGYISQMYGGFAICNRQGQIEIKSYIDSDYPVDTSRYWDTFEHHDVTEKIEKITCYTGKDSGGNDDSVSVGSGTRGISFSNPFMTQGMLNNVWKVLSGYEYMPGSVKFMGDPRVDPWDVLTVTDLNGTAYKVPVMTMTHEFDGGLITSVEAVGRSEVEQESGYKGPTTKEMDRYYAQLVVIDKALINKLDVDTANITYATIKNLEVTKERVEEIYGEYGEFQKLTVNNFSAANGRIDVLDSNYANIRNLLSGAAGIGDLQNIHLTSDNAVIDTALIRTAVMQSVTIGDLLAGTISTNKFKIASDDGGIQISGATQQWKDANGVVRMQAGKDAQGNFTFALFDETGKGTLIDATGVKSEAIADGLIVNSMVSESANIAAAKLDIDSLFTEINNSSKVIKSNRIWLDDSGQSLNQAYTKMTQDITDIGEEASEAKETAGRTETKVTEIKSGIDGMSTKMSEISTDLEGVTDGTLLFNVKYEDNGDDTTTVTAVLYKAGKEVTKDYPEAWFSWKRRTEEGETFLQRGYSVTVDNEDYMFGGVVIGEFVRYVEMPLVVGGKLLVIGNKAVCVNVDA